MTSLAPTAGRAETPDRRSSGYRPDIDGLRALAIVTVVAFHSHVPGFAGGYVGVDVFFVVSGYLITQLLIRELETTGSISLTAFYARRVRRLIPAFVATLVVTSVLAAFVLTPDPQMRWFSQSLLAAATATANVFFWVKTSGYFGAAAENQPLLHTWSLAVEEQFYVVWPLLLLAVGRVSRGVEQLALRLAAATSLASLASFVFAAWYVGQDQQASFYLLPTRLWEMGVGGALACALASGRFVPRISQAVAAFGLLAVLASVALLDGSSSFPGILAAPTVLGTSLVIAADGRGRVGSALGHRWLVAVGRRSYSWYLIHWPLLVLVRISTLEVNWIRDVAISVAALGLADLSFRFVEQPFRVRQRGTDASPRRIVLAGAASLAGILVLGLALLSDTERSSLVSMSDSERQAMSENRTASEICPNERATVGDPVDCTFDASGDSVPALEPGIPRVILVGDSHALALLPAVQQLAIDQGWALEVLWDTGCPFMPMYTGAGGSPAVSGPCVAENAARVAGLEERRESTRLTLITGRYTSYLRPPAPSSALEQWGAGLRSALSDLDTSTIVFVHDVPRFATEVPECLVRRDDCGVARKTAETYRSETFAEIEAVASSIGAQTWDPFSALCPGQTCIPATDEGTVLYRDDDHLSIAGALHLAPTLADSIASMLDEAGDPE